MAEKVIYGIKNVHVAKITRSESGVVSFGVPVALPGASELTLPKVGDLIKIYADNIVYYKLPVNQGYDGSLSIYSIPNWFAVDYLGYFIDGNGVLVENANAAISDFALMFEFNTDTAKTKRGILYNVTAMRSDVSGKTKEESVDPQAFSIPITASPATDTEYVQASVVGDSTDSAWSGWFSSAYTPAVASQYKVTVLVQVGATPVADALVVVGGKLARTDSTGNAYFMLPNGTYDVLTSDESHTPDADTVTVSSAAISKTITLV